MTCSTVQRCTLGLGHQHAHMLLIPQLTKYTGPQVVQILCLFLPNLIKRPVENITLTPPTVTVVTEPLKRISYPSSAILFQTVSGILLSPSGLK